MSEKSLTAAHISPNFAADFYSNALQPPGCRQSDLLLVARGNPAGRLRIIKFIAVHLSLNLTPETREST